MICENCGKEHNGLYGSGRFCCKKCAKSYSTKNIKNKLKAAKCVDCSKLIYIHKQASIKICRCDECKLIHSVPLNKCIVCGKEFRRRHAKCCSQECLQEYRKNRKQYLSSDSILKLQKAGQKSAHIQLEAKRSKNEIKFCQLCESYFNNVDHNKSIFNGWDADVIIHDIKYAILWNGKCHYEPIFGIPNLNRVINRDKIKLKEIRKFGYVPYIIKDLGKVNDDFVNEKFNEFIKYIENQKIKY